MNTFSKIISLACLGMMMTACVGESENPPANQVGTPAEEQPQAQDSVITVSGVALDGSARNPIIEVNGDERPFELPADIDITWDCGDTLTIKYIPTELGDSVVDAKVGS